MLDSYGAFAISQTAYASSSAVTAARGAKSLRMRLLRHERLEGPQREDQEHDVHRAEDAQPHDRQRLVWRRGDQRGGTADATDNHRNRDWIQQDGQQDIAR